VIGNTVGVVMYKAVSSSLSEREALLIERYLGEQRVLDEQLGSEYQELIEQLDASMSDYLGVLERAFSLTGRSLSSDPSRSRSSSGWLLTRSWIPTRKSSPTFSTSPMPLKRQQSRAVNS